MEIGRFTDRALRQTGLGHSLGNVVRFLTLLTRVDISRHFDTLFYGAYLENASPANAAAERSAESLLPPGIGQRAPLRACRNTGAWHHAWACVLNIEGIIQACPDKHHR
jgi:hypothetical protein